MTGVDHRVGQFQRAFPAPRKMIGSGAAGPGRFGGVADQRQFLPGVRFEAIDADHRIQSGFPDDGDMV